jgi:hypothetical protein
MTHDETEESEPASTFVPVEERPYESLTPSDRKLAEAVDELFLCAHGLEEWDVQQQDSEFEIPYNPNLNDYIYFDNENLDTNTRLANILKAQDECRWKDAYAELYLQVNINKVIDRLDPKGPDMTDSPHTDPVTQKDLDDAAEAAEEFACRTTNQHLGLCRANLPLTGENRGFQPEGADCMRTPNHYDEFGNFVKAGEVKCPLKEKQAWLDGQTDTQNEKLRQWCQKHYDFEVKTAKELPYYLTDGLCKELIEK